MMPFLLFSLLWPASSQKEWPQRPLPRTRHHCPGCEIGQQPKEVCDLTYAAGCSRQAGCGSANITCLEPPGIKPDVGNFRCCCGPSSGVNNPSICLLDGWWHWPPWSPIRCVLKCCDVAACGDGCLDHGEGCGMALPPWDGSCRLHGNSSAREQTKKNCCLNGVGVNCSSVYFQPCCLEADVQVGYTCQPKTAGCKAPPSQNRGSISIWEGLAIFVSSILVLLLCILGGLAWQRRSRDRLLREDGSLLDLREVTPTKSRHALIILNSTFHGGFNELQDLPSEELRDLFSQKLNFADVLLEENVPTIQRFLEILSQFLQRVNGKDHVLLVIYFITHGVNVEGNLHLAMTAASPEVVVKPYYVTKDWLRSILRDLHDKDVAWRSFKCKPLAYASIVVYADTCQKDLPSSANRPAEGWKMLECEPGRQTRHLRVRDKPARIGFVHACESGRVACGWFTQHFLALAGLKQSFRSLHDQLKARLEDSTGAGRQERLCVDDGSLNFNDLFLVGPSTEASTAASLVSATGGS